MKWIKDCCSCWPAFISWVLLCAPASRGDVPGVGWRERWQPLFFIFFILIVLLFICYQRSHHATNPPPFTPPGVVSFLTATFDLKLNRFQKLMRRRCRFVRWNYAAGLGKKKKKKKKKKWNEQINDSSSKSDPVGCFIKSRNKSSSPLNE